MTSLEAIKLILSELDEQPMVHATGFIARLAQSVKKRPQDFYMIGSMGMASSIAIGVALCKPKEKVLALDGDGAVLMNLGALPTAGALKVKNFIHVVIDNESYESTGSQPSFSSVVALERIAAASGWAYAKKVTSPAALKKEMRVVLKKSGPSFLLVKVREDKRPPAPRIEDTPERITHLFSESLK